MAVVLNTATYAYINFNAQVDANPLIYNAPVTSVEEGINKAIIEKRSTIAWMHWSRHSRPISIRYQQLLIHS